MFNLEKAVAEWRRQMAAEGVKILDVLDELESHLRDEVEEQVSRGLSIERAFEQAVQRIGNARILNAEFGKIGSATSGKRRKLLYFICFNFAAFIMVITTWTFWEYELSPFERNLGLFLVSLISLYLIALPKLYLFFPGPVKKGISFWSFLVSLWIILEFLAAIQVIQFQPGIALTMINWSLCGAFAATAFAEICFMHGNVPELAGGGFPSLACFTPIAQQSLEIASDEAARLHHDFVGTEHALLGLLRLEEGALPNVFQRLGLEREQVRAEIEKQVGFGPLSPAHNPPCTPRLRKALELAAGQAKILNHSQPNAAHIFLGLLLEPDGVAGYVLRNLGIDAQNARSEILKEMRSGGSDGPWSATAGS